MVDAAPLVLWALLTDSNLTIHRSGGGAGASRDDSLGVAAGEGEAETSGGRKARLLSVKMWPHWSTREVQAALLQAAGMAHSKWISCSAVRLRDARGSLVPLTPTTLRSSPTRPLHMEIMATGRGANLPLLPNAFRETVLNITQRLEARVTAVEAGLVGLEGRRAALVEEELQQIQDTLDFMSHRLELTPHPAWVKSA